MPRLVNHLARFETIREAVCTIVVRDGVAALSQQSVAREIGMSLPSIKRTIANASVLPGIGADLLLRAHRRSCVFLPRGLDDFDAASDFLTGFIPSSQDDLRFAKAWNALTSGFAPVDRDIRDYLEQWHEHLAGSMSVFLRSATWIDEADRAVEADRLAALLTGLTAGRCAGTLSQDTARDVIERHLRSLGWSENGWSEDGRPVAD